VHPFLWCGGVGNVHLEGVFEVYTHPGGGGGGGAAYVLKSGDTIVGLLVIAPTALGVALDVRGAPTAELGSPVIQWRGATGDVVGHFDSDGGGGMSSEHFQWSELGTVAIDASTDLNAGSAILTVGKGGAHILAFSAGGGYAATFGSLDAADRVMSLFAHAGQTANLFEAYDDQGDTPQLTISPSGALTVAPSGGGRPLKLVGLPTSDPAEAGVVWNSAGTLKVSAG
jgi:hypothetical protein